MEAGVGVHTLPRTQAVHDLVHLALLVLQALTRIHVGDVDDGFECRVQHLVDRINVGPGVEEVTDVQRFEPLVAIELLVVGVSHRLKPGFVLRTQHRLTVSTEVRARHRHQMNLVTGNEGTQLAAQFVVWVAGHVVKLVNRDQAVVECVDAQFLHGKAEGCVGADQHLVITG